jgi:hypothetical protein
MLEFLIIPRPVVLLLALEPGLRPLEDFSRSVLDTAQSSQMLRLSCRHV